MTAPKGRPAGFEGAFRDDEAALAVYSEAAGIARIQPTAIAVPHDARDVPTLVRWARQTGNALVPRGSGSSMAGGAIGAFVVVDLSRLRRLQDVDGRSRSIRGEAGVLRGELARRAAAARLRFPVDPSSGEFCTIGGMAGTNAAGAHSLKHGSMRPWVLGLECVFDDGSIAMVRRGAPPPDVPALRRFAATAHDRLGGIHTSHAVLKESSGYAVDAFMESGELVDLLVGSEGTLAIFTAVELALIPAVEATASLLIGFHDLDAAVSAAVVARDHGAACCELLDRTFLAIAARGGQPLPVPVDTEAVLLVELEGSDPASAEADAERLAGVMRRAGAQVSIIAVDAAREMELWAFRHAASPALSRLDPSLRSMQFIEDAAVPPSALGEYVRGVRSILETNDTPGVIFGHAGDAHVHVNPLVDVRRTDWRQRVEHILDATTGLVARLGGTLSGEHGDGRLRTPLMSRVWSPDALARFAAIKQAFDPTGIFNPGVKVSQSGDRAIDAVKYDPDLPALPVAARRALESIEHERAYSRFRLDLL